MNKTPIQELIDWLDALIKTNNTQKIRLSLFRSGLEDRLQKEKQFAFDFYTQGQCYCDNPEDNSFEKFYSQYVERKSK